MKSDRYFSFNRLFNLIIIIGLFCAWISLESGLSGEIGFGIAFGIIAALFIIAPIIFVPCCYLFDEDGVTIVYTFLPNERYLWKNIQAITVDYSPISSRHPILFFESAFAVEGRAEGKHRFYMEGHIRKTRRTKRYIERYWDGTVTGYFGEGIKAWFERRKNKKGQEDKHYSADEVAPMECAARDKADDAIRPLADRAAYQGLEMRKKFLFITDDFDELNHRPKVNYTYTAVIELCQPGETDEDRIVYISVDLVYVRIGKTAYRGVENEDALTELQEFTEDALNEIRQNGIEAFIGK